MTQDTELIKKRLLELGRKSYNSGIFTFTDFLGLAEQAAFAEVRRELEEEKYNLDTPVEIGIMKDYKAFYRVGSGRLIHGAEGFHLTGCGGDLDYKQKPLTTYSLNADFHWYEQGDVISIGDHEALYFCFPPKDVPVSKIRLATEELYKLHHDRDFHLRHSDGSERPERKESASAK
jgi:hypothetical protein